MFGKDCYHENCFVLLYENMFWVFDLSVMNSCIDLSAPNGNKLPAKLNKSKDGTYTVEFSPTVVGK